MRRAFLYVCLWLGIAKKRAHEAYASKAARNTKARWVYPSGLLLRFLINEKGQGALEMRENDRSKPGSALLKRTL